MIWRHMRGENVMKYSSYDRELGCEHHWLMLGIGTPGFYVVCEYYPAGNIVGDNNQFFIDNVKKQVKGKPTDTVESGVTSEGSGWRDVRCWAVVLGVAEVVSFVIVL